MQSSLTITQAQLVLPDRVVTGDLIIEEGIITEISPHTSRTAGEVINGTGLTVLPGLIDSHVHFREPGWPEVEDIASGSSAAAAGGITSFLDMPDNHPPCRTEAALQNKLERAAKTSLVHYGFYVEATAGNIEHITRTERTCGAVINPTALSDTEMMREAIEMLFAKSRIPIAFVPQDPGRIRERRMLYRDTHNPSDHPRIYDEETATNATAFAIHLAQRYGTRLHLLQISTEEEAHLIRLANASNITCSVSPQHLLLSAEQAYDELGTLVQCDPPIRTRRHQRALWEHLLTGCITHMASGHSPTTLQRKKSTYPTSASGIPSIEWSLPLLLNQETEGKVTLNQIASWWSDGPARAHQLPRKGRLEVGYHGDICVVDRQMTKTVQPQEVRSRCGWTPWNEQTLTGWPVLTAVLGKPVFRDGEVLPSPAGRELTYAR